MIADSRAGKIAAVLSEIERQFNLYEQSRTIAGQRAAVVSIDEQVGMLRDLLWHEMPRRFREQMDGQEGRWPPAIEYADEE